MRHKINSGMAGMDKNRSKRNYRVRRKWPTGKEAGWVLKYNEQDVVWLITRSKNCSQLEPAFCGLQSIWWHQIWTPSISRRWVMLEWLQHYVFGHHHEEEGFCGSTFHFILNSTLQVHEGVQTVTSLLKFCHSVDFLERTFLEKFSQCSWRR